MHCLRNDGKQMPVSSLVEDFACYSVELEQLAFARSGRERVIQILSERPVLRGGIQSIRQLRDVES